MPTIVQSMKIVKLLLAVSSSLDRTGIDGRVIDNSMHASEIFDRNRMKAALGHIG